MFQAMDTRRGIETRFVKLVPRDDLPIAPDEYGTVIEVTSQGVHTRGLLEFQDMASLLARILENWRHEKKPELLLAIDASTPWKKVVEVFGALEASGFQDVGLVFSRKAVAMTPPPKSAIDGQLDAAEKADPSDRATKVAELATEVVKDCESIKSLFASIDGGDKTTAMIEGLPPALIECNCKCDVAALKSLFFRLLANRAPTTTIHVTLRGEALSLNETLPWADASKQMAAGKAFKASAYTHPELPPVNR
jgi:hypothetical protein